MTKHLGRLVAVMVFTIVLAPTAAMAQADYTGTPPPNAGPGLTDNGAVGPSDGAEVLGRQFVAPAAFDGSDSAFSMADVVLGMPFLLALLFLLLWLRRRRDEEEVEDDVAAALG